MSANPHSLIPQQLTSSTRIVGPLSAGKAQAFAAAMLFAQDYGILAASVQDRPFVPISRIVVRGIPREVKAAFRGCWEEKMSEREDERVVCVTLSDAVTALRQ